MSGSALFVQPPNSVPIPMLADADGQCYYASGGISRAAVGFPTPSGSYTAGQTIGSFQSIGPVARAVGNGSGIINGIVVIDALRNVAQVDFLFFNSAPAGTFTDKTEAVLSTSDIGKFIGNAHVTDWTVYGATTGSSVGNVSGLGLYYQLGKTGSVVNTNVFVVVVARAPMTLNANFLYYLRCLPD